MLGTKAVQSLVLSFSFLSINKVGDNSLFDFDAFLKRSLMVASLSKLLMSKLSDEDAEEVFLAGLLSNLGELILACTLPEEYNTVLEKVQNEGMELIEAEREIFDADHHLIGYEVAKQWKLSVHDRTADLSPPRPQGLLQQGRENPEIHRGSLPRQYRAGYPGVG